MRGGMRAVMALLLSVGMLACASDGPRSGIKSSAVRAPILSTGGQTVALRQGPTLRTHQVKAGETLYTLAFERGLDVADLSAWNGLSEKTPLRAGQALLLEPPAAPIRDASAGHLERARPTVPPMTETKRPVVVASGWVWPVHGQVTRAFDPKQGSKGLDIVADEGVPIQAAAAGDVVYAGDGLRGYGNLIIIRHTHSTLSAYAHQARLKVSEGQRVSRGQTIGEMGRSDADRVKLHFQIREFGKPVDPRAYLPKV